MIWGNTKNGGENKVYVYDFGNARYWLPYETEIYGIKKEGVDVIAEKDLDRGLYENGLIGNFERMFWTVSQKLTQDYASCRFAGWTDEVKKDASRNYITDFVGICSRFA
jgi:hypothetical protein